MLSHLKSACAHHVILAPKTVSDAQGQRYVIYMLVALAKAPQNWQTHKQCTGAPTSVIEASILHRRIHQRHIWQAGLIGSRSTKKGLIAARGVDEEGSPACAEHEHCAVMHGDWPVADIWAQLPYCLESKGNEAFVHGALSVAWWDESLLLSNAILQTMCKHVMKKFQA